MSQKLQNAKGDFDTDVAIIGSGFGGSVAALRLIACGPKSRDK